MRILFAILSFSILLSCHSDSCDFSTCEEEPRFEVKATVLELGDKFLIDVYEGEYASGEYLVIIPDGISIQGNNRENLTRGDIKVGDKLKIVYNGQVMMSYPAQIVAREIRVI